jgi:hypothetical protein
VHFFPDKRVAPWVTPKLTGKRERTHGAVVEKVLPVIPCGVNRRMINHTGEGHGRKRDEGFRLAGPSHNLSAPMLGIFETEIANSVDI